MELSPIADQQQRRLLLAKSPKCFISSSSKPLTSVIGVLSRSPLSTSVWVFFFFCESRITWVPGLITLAGSTMEPLHRLSTQELSAQTQPAPFPHGKERERRLAGRLYSPAAALRWPLLSQSPVSQVCKALTQRDGSPPPPPSPPLILSLFPQRVY